MTAPDLAPCPFCGSNDAVVIPSDPFPFTWGGFCKSCAAEGPAKDDEANGIAAWNKRTALSSPAPTLTAAKEAAEKQLAYCLKMRIGIGEKLDEAEKQCEKLRAALQKIADLPTIDADCTLVSAEAVDIACDALGLCRECGLKLVIQGRGCSVCGALASTSPKEET